MGYREVIEVTAYRPWRGHVSSGPLHHELRLGRARCGHQRRCNVTGDEREPGIEIVGTAVVGHVRPPGQLRCIPAAKHKFIVGVPAEAP